MLERGQAVGVEWDGELSANSFGNKVRKAEAEFQEFELAADRNTIDEPKQAKPASPAQDDEAVIRSLWRQGKRKEALSYGRE
jgi:hypothetical protein